MFPSSPHTSTPAKTRDTYMIAIPWATLGAASAVRVALVGPGNIDRLPDSGWVTVGK
jgi:hypothetical protein